MPARAAAPIACFCAASACACARFTILLTHTEQNKTIMRQ
jgi:hypothetical protein